MFKKRNSKLSFGLECALLLLAIFVFSWGLEGKLSQYQSHSIESSITSAMAKLAPEKRSALSVRSMEDQVRPRFTPESLLLAVFGFSLQGHDIASWRLDHPEPGPRTPGRYNLHSLDLMRRPPPPVLS
jgi:hypothetical protein